MNFQDSKAEMTRFYEGDEILRVFRGSITKAAEAGQRFALEHPRIQKTVHYQTLRAGLKGEDIRSPVFEALVDFCGEIDDNPRTFCEPFAIPEDWNSFAAAALEYASHKWWFDALKLDDLCKPASFQSWLSRETSPRAWSEIRERAVDWYNRVMQALDDWELRLFEKAHAYEMMDTWVKDILDADGELAEMREFKRLRQYNFIVYDGRNTFDPANPEQAQFIYQEMDESDWLPDFQKRVEAGWSLYRPSKPQPDRVESWSAVANFCDDNLATSWKADCEKEAHLSWGPRLRGMTGTPKVVRIKVKRDARHAVEGEDNCRDRKRTWVNGQRVDVFQEYVWRWRDIDVFDNWVTSEVKDKAIALGFAMQAQVSDVPRELLRQVDQPIEEDDPDVPREYTID
ncbi:hypothetical protein [uncultured Ruegeria sp.]|uniref:hypothetical protein n=1 Tax=uncultured Ruegeria sp. TaxID=259304 RepID=UPI0026133F59|nr:hypothetical protein [uncultured Ruegeria sp.]